MAEIIAKNEFTGQVGSVVFDKGRGRTDNEGMLAYFRKHSDTFEVVAGEPTEDEGPKLTPKEALKAELEALGLPTDGKMDELKARLEASKTVDDESQGQGGKDDEGSKDADDGDQGTPADDGSTDGSED